MFITSEPISIGEFLSQNRDEACGAVASFVGIVRNHNQGRAVRRVHYDCYPSMAEKEMQSILDRIKTETGVADINLLHRIGRLEIGDVAVAIHVSAPHREQAFSACRSVIEEIKKRVPIWKKEIYADSSAQWVNTGGEIGRVSR